MEMKFQNVCVHTQNELRPPGYNKKLEFKVEKFRIKFRMEFNIEY